MKNIGLLFASLLVTVIAVVAVSVLFTNRANTPVTPVDTSLYLQEQRNVKGSASASATLVEFSDFQCPACKSVQPLIQDILNRYGDRVRFVYRHYPLRQIHPNAALAARASEAAANQRAFFAYHDMLFTKQEEWEKEADPTKLFVQYAKQLSLDVGKFEKDLGDASLDQRITKDEQDGLALGVNATPTFYVNGVATDANMLEVALQGVLNANQTAQ